MKNVDIKEFGENFLYDLDGYPEQIWTDRLILIKSEMTSSTITYSISMIIEEESKIGEISLVSDGEILYGMSSEYRNHGYMTEALTGILEESRRSHYLEIGNDNIASKKVAKKLGFKKISTTGNVNIYRKNT